MDVGAQGERGDGKAEHAHDFLSLGRSMLEWSRYIIEHIFSFVKGA